MTDAERAKLAFERRLIFENVANGVATEQIMAAFRRSRIEVQKEIEFVARKIREYRFKRLSAGSAHARHLVPCDTYAEIRAHRRTLLETLSKIGPETLASDLTLPPIRSHRIESDSDVEEVAHRVTHA